MISIAEDTTTAMTIILDEIPPYTGGDTMIIGGSFGVTVVSTHFFMFDVF